MTYLAALLRGERIADVYSDSEVTYLMLENGTQVTIGGAMFVQPLVPEPALVAGTAPAGS
jgi:hypothetical protein